MFKKFALLAFVLLILCTQQSVFSQQHYADHGPPPPNEYQQHYTYYGPPPPPPNGYQQHSYPAGGPDYAPPVYAADSSYFEGGSCTNCKPSGIPMYPQQGQIGGVQTESFGDVYDQGCNCQQCIGSPAAAGHGLFHRQRGCANGRCGNGRCGNQPDCRNCNWGPSYLAFFGGAGFLDNLDNRQLFDTGLIPGVPSMPDMAGVREIGFSTSSRGAIGASIGRYYYRQLRSELEYTYRVHDFSDTTTAVYIDNLATSDINDTFVSSVSTPAAGTLNTHSLMANWVFDLKLRTVGCFNSYIGGGLGALYLDGFATTATDSYTFEDTAFAFQGIGGINYPIRDRIDLYAEYRYLGANRFPVLRTDNMGTENLGSFRYDSHNIFFGCRVLR